MKDLPSDMKGFPEEEKLKLRPERQQKLLGKAWGGGAGGIGKRHIPDKVRVHRAPLRSHRWLLRETQVTAWMEPNEQLGEVGR